MSEQTELFGALLELAPDAMVGVDADGVIVFVNAQVERLFGFGREELLGASVELLVPEQARPVHPTHRDGYAARPHHRPMGAGAQLAARRKDGSEFPADISLAAIDLVGQRLVCAAIRDVTDRVEADRERRRLAEQALRDREERRRLQAQRLESLGQLAGGVAHDFNNLLAVIANYSAFAREAAEALGHDGLVPVVEDLIQVERAADAATALTRQLLTFARRDVARPERLDLDDVVRSVGAMLERTLGDDVELDVRLAGDLPPVEADAGQLQQVLMNVAINGSHAMPDGGRLTIETSTVVLDGSGTVSASPGRYVVLRVIDQGVGMDAATLARAFEPFFTTRPRGHGTGLGLATTYGIVTEAGGAIDLTSSPGAGTCFTAYLPAADPVPAVRPSASPRPAAGEGETVLVVDDERAVQEVAVRILVRNGYDVIGSCDPDEALRIAADLERPIQLLVTDVVMPRRSGPSLARELRRILPELRVLFVSGYAHDELAASGRLEPGVELLGKPFTEVELLDRVARCFGRS